MSITSAIRSGAFLDCARIKRVSVIILIIPFLGLLATFSARDGLLDYRGEPIGTDFANVWTAGRMALEGNAADVFDPIEHYKKQQEVFGEEAPFFGWHYPPLFLLAASLLAFLPYLPAWAAWQAITIIPYLKLMRAIVPHKLTTLVAIAFPAVFVNVGHGQNGFLTASLIGGGLYFLNKRPVLAGILFGLLAYKPQFGILLPLVLMATGRWRAFAAATVCVLSVSALTTAIFGVDVWPAFLEGGSFTRDVILERGATGWEKIQSLFSALRHWGAPVYVAYAAQGVLAISLAVSTVWLWRGDAPFEAKAAGLIAASLLVSPYFLDYDLMALGPAIAFLTALGLRQGFLPYEKSVLALAWAVPLFARSISMATTIPLGLIATSCLFVIALQHARARGGVATNPNGEPVLAN